MNFIDEWLAAATYSSLIESGVRQVLVIEDGTGEHTLAYNKRCLGLKTERLNTPMLIKRSSVETKFWSRQVTLGEAMCEAPVSTQTRVPRWESAGESIYECPYFREIEHADNPWSHFASQEKLSWFFLLFQDDKILKADIREPDSVLQSEASLNQQETPSLF